ncbi:hypothetical protein BK660_07475 [Pseudomonas brassicacearum]|uniref:BIG2 domain-containing protein n=1 Tax=Pseudomonas brassicacearum TaxID=930166 RepID=A0A423ICE1_9PSED|nr:hypothetical protein [Pseudomonas brassicacearum]RON23087.1 hypothetical protein BK660_07475 [Pseudomonas brassicacearum]
MTANESTPGVLANAPVKFAGATPGVIVKPVPPAGVPVEGLPQSSFREVVRRDGSREGAVQAVVDPPLGGNYLNMALYVQGPWDTQWQLIERKPVAPADQNAPVYFNVFQSLLNDGVHRFMYEVERTSGNSGPSTESWALYHRDLPGGNDVPGTGDHPDLRISLPPELGSPPQIGKDEVDRGVVATLSYSFMNAYDVITLELNRERFTFTVQPGEVGKPYVIVITRAMFERAGSHPEFAISYTAVSQVNNPTHKRRWSSVIKANVNTDRVALEKAILREVPTENNDDPNTVDLAKLNGNPLSALIHLVGTIWKAGDSIKLVFTAELNGGVVATHEETHPITQVPSQFLWSIPNNKIIANSTVKVVYQQIRGTPIATSTPAIAQVIGTGVITLKPATLVAPAQNPIDPWLYSTGVTVRVEFLVALAGDKAQLIEINPLHGTTPFPAVAFNANKRTNTVLNQAFLAARHGRQLEFRWALIRGGKEIARSGPLVLKVNRIVEGDSRLPTPIIVGQTGSELDVNKLVAGDTLSIAPWLSQVAGQYVWLQLSGFNNSGASIFFDVLDGVLHNETQGLTRPLGQALVDWFKTLKHGTAVTMTFRVNYSGVRDVLTAVTFPVRTYTVKAAPDIPELIVDTSLLSLKGENFTFRYSFYYTGNDAPGTAADRSAKGGVGTITYESLKPLIASVDAKGVVRSEGNGRTTIVVRDTAGQQKSFDVETANVTHVEHTPALTLANARTYISQVRGTMIANNLADRRVQIASRRSNLFIVTIGVPAPNSNNMGQISISRNLGASVRFGVNTFKADGTTYVHYWINRPAS